MKNKLIVLSTISSFLFLSACETASQKVVSGTAATSSSSGSTSGSAETIDINNDEINKLMNNNVPIVDIRTSDEWYQF